MVIYIAIALGIPVVSKVIKGIRDKRAENERKSLMRRAEMEALRTGRTGGSAEYVSNRPAAPQATYSSPQTTPPEPSYPPTHNTPPSPAAPPPGAARAGQPRYVQLPGGVILELPPAPTGPTAPGSGPNAGSVPRPAPARPTPRPTPARPAPQRSVAQRQVSRQQQQPQRPVARTPAPRPQQQRSQAPQPNVQTTQQTVARREAAESQSRAQLTVRDRQEREAEERRRLTEERERAAREELQRQQTDKIVADAYRQDVAVAGERSGKANTVNVGNLKIKTRDFRRILVLREILDPPISMRDGY